MWIHRSSAPLGLLPKKGDFEPEKAVLGADRADSGSVRARLGLERPRGGGGWKFTPVSYRTSALWSHCPERLTKHLGRSSNAKNAHKRQKSSVTNKPTDIAGYSLMHATKSFTYSLKVWLVLSLACPH